MEPELKPTLIAYDFKQTTIKTIKNQFLESDTRGCLFHFTKKFPIKI